MTGLEGDGESMWVVSLPGLGGRVRVIDGPHAGREGIIAGVTEELGMLELDVLLPGGPVRHELEYWQVDRI